MDDCCQGRSLGLTQGGGATLPGGQITVMPKVGKQVLFVHLRLGGHFLKWSRSLVGRSPWCAESLGIWLQRKK